MKAIAAVGSDWGIGNNNRLLFSIPEDMKFFKETTMGHTVVMGRKTLESFPGGRPLKDRTNIVLTTAKNYDARGAIVVSSRESLLSCLYDMDAFNDAIVVGGGQVFNDLLEFIDTAYITKVDSQKPADTFFPDLDESGEWEIVSASEEKEFEGLKFRFLTYKRKQ